MNISFVTATSIQQQWCEDAIDLCLYPFVEFMESVTVTVNFDDTGAVNGHADYMWANETGATSVDVGGWRTNGDAQQDRHVKRSPEVFGDLSVLKKVFMGSFIHELGHAIAFMQANVNLTFVEQMAPLFVYDGDETGAGVLREGTPADWNPTDKPWEDRIQEAVAEAFKDGFLPEAHRYTENATNWVVPSDNWAEFMNILMPCERTGGGGDT